MQDFHRSPSNAVVVSVFPFLLMSFPSALRSYGFLVYSCAYFHRLQGISLQFVRLGEYNRSYQHVAIAVESTTTITTPIFPSTMCCLACTGPVAKRQGGTPRLSAGCRGGPHVQDGPQLGPTSGPVAKRQGGTPRLSTGCRLLCV